MASGIEKEGRTDRRSFLNWIWVGLGALVTLEFVWVALSFLRSRPSRAAVEKTGTVVIAGRVDDFEKNSVTAFQRGRFYLVRLSDGGFLAITRQCTHLVCTIPWVAEEKKFKCPCHASVFDIAGNVIQAPASRPLDVYPIVIVNDEIRVDTRRRRRRSQYRKNQVMYPKA